MTDEQDPTGMSRLLAGLKETAPMPEDLSERIRARLAREQDARSGAEPAEAGGDAGFWDEMDGGGRRPRRAGGAGRWILAVAAAAVLAVGIGAIYGVQDDGADTASTAAGSGADDGAESSAEAAPSPRGGDPDEVPAFAVTDSGVNYTRDDLAEQAAQIEKDPRTVPQLKDLSIVGAMSTAAGAKDCLNRLGAPTLQPVVIDVASFEGQAGLLLIAEPVPEGTPQAWVVTTGCKQIWDGPFEISQD